jgi:hypothetical protein
MPLGALLRNIHQLTLSIRDSGSFIIALLNPKPVNDRLRAIRCVAIARELAFDARHTKSVRRFEALGSQHNRSGYSLGPAWDRSAAAGKGYGRFLWPSAIAC